MPFIKESLMEGTTWTSVMGKAMGAPDPRVARTCRAQAASKVETSKSEVIEDIGLKTCVHDSTL